MTLSREELLNKYSVPGPRYTSYPTVPYWETSHTQDQWVDSLNRAFDHGKAEGCAIYVHIPFCESLCTYCGCNTRITRNHGVSEPYIKTVLKEWELYKQLLGRKEIPLSDLHLGGGTPTFLNDSELTLLIEGLMKGANKTEHSEFALEIDPRVTSESQLRTLRELGFNRVSMGIQDFDPKVQETVRRVQSFDQVKKLTDQAREMGYRSLNYDLIYGLPFQTQDSVRKTIQLVTELRPDRIAFYSYAHVPWIKPSQRRFTEDDLPPPEEKRALYEIGRSLFEEAGYKEIGMDHFALEEDSLYQSTLKNDLHRNFMGYTSQHVSPILGLGVSAIGDSWFGFSQNEKVLEKYVRGVEAGSLPILRGHRLTDEDLVIRRHILNLSTNLYTNWDKSEEKTEFLADVSTRLTPYIEDELIELTGTSCRILERGRPFLRNICMAFDARLARKQMTEPTFSKTI